MNYVKPEKKGQLNLHEFIKFFALLEKQNLHFWWCELEQVNFRTQASKIDFAKIWTEAVKSHGVLLPTTSGDRIPFETFLFYFWDGLSVSQNSIIHDENLVQALKIILKVSHDEISKEDFQIFEDLFAPIFPQSPALIEDRVNFLESICDLYNQPYFVGHMDQSSCMRELNSAKVKFKKDVFMVRISAPTGTNPISTFCFSTTHPQLDHMTIQKEFYSNGIILLIEELKKQFNLIPFKVTNKRTVY